MPATMLFDQKSRHPAPLAIAFIRYRFMRSPLLGTIVQVIVGGGVVFAIGIWLGRLGAQ
jgi:erythrin-vacuolar iron transport family protein